MKLGIRQLELLRSVGVQSALVVPDRLSQRMVELGVLTSSHEDGSFAHITPAGLRALADAAEQGRITLFTMPDRKRKQEGDAE